MFAVFAEVGPETSSKRTRSPSWTSPEISKAPQEGRAAVARTPDDAEDRGRRDEQDRGEGHGHGAPPLGHEGDHPPDEHDQRKSKALFETEFGRGLIL